MAINNNDVKLFESQRLSGEEDGGGQVTGREVIDGNVKAKKTIKGHPLFSVEKFMSVLLLFFLSDQEPSPEGSGPIRLSLSHKS